MRIFTFILTTAALLASASATAGTGGMYGRCAHSKRHAAKTTPARKTAAEVKQMIAKAESTSNPWRATTEKVFGWDGEEWQLDETYTIEYDAQGRKASEVMMDYEGYFTRTSYKYDANGMVTEQLVEVSEDGETYENSSMTVRTYDPIVTNVITTNRGYSWDGTQWLLIGNNYNRNITRNADGNVTLVEIAVWYDGKYDPTIRTVVSYGDDGTATSIKESVLNYNNHDFYWEDSMAMNDIVWDRTDGQIIDIEGLGTGANRILSCDQTDNDAVIHVEFTYDGDNFVAISTGELDGESVEGRVSYEALDDNGSFIQTNSYTYTSEEFGSYGESETVTERYDEFGLLLESKYVVEYDGFEEVAEDVRGEVTYDPSYGYPLTYTLSQAFLDEETGEYIVENMMRVEYSDYKNIFSAVDAIESAAGATEYYTLQGMRVSRPAAGGLYIVKAGDKVSKIIAK